MEILKIYIEVLDEFKHKNPMFIGSKFIFAPRKRKSNESTAFYFQIIHEMHAIYPYFLAGFDLVGQEDTSPGLI